MRQLGSNSSAEVRIVCMNARKRSLPLPGLEAFRFNFSTFRTQSLWEPVGMVRLQKQVWGRLWRDLDTRYREDFTELTPEEQATWVESAEQELLEDWFSRELKAARA